MLARTAVRLARDVQPLAPATTGTPTVEPYRDSVYEQPAEVSSGALTKPRASSDPEPKRGWRRHRAGAGSGATPHICVGRTRSSSRHTETGRPAPKGLGDLLFGSPQRSPSNSRSVMYLTITGAETCGMSLSGPIFASCTAARNTSVGAIEPLIGFSGFW